jgi:hypothetical protein
MQLNSDLRFSKDNIFWFLFFTAYFILGCTTQSAGLTHTPTSEPLLTPYQTKTPRRTPQSPTNESNVDQNLTSLPSPTPTPFVYQVVENDTLTAIAFRHSIELEDLIAANSGIDPNFLTIGMTLTIPLEGVLAEIAPTATPIPLNLSLPECYPSSGSSIQCLSVVENNTGLDVENVSVEFSIQDPATGDLKKSTGIMLLNILPAGKRAAVIGSFPIPFSQDLEVQVDLQSVIPVSKESLRYLQSEINIENIEINLNRRKADLIGRIRILPGQPAPGKVWIAAYAYDSQNMIVGTRKMVVDDLVETSEWIPFNMTVYSLGPSIDQVEVVTEIRP